MGGRGRCEQLAQFKMNTLCAWCWHNMTCIRNNIYMNGKKLMPPINRYTNKRFFTHAGMENESNCTLKIRSTRKHNEKNSIWLLPPTERTQCCIHYPLSIPLSNSMYVAYVSCECKNWHFNIFSIFYMIDTEEAIPHTHAADIKKK